MNCWHCETQLHCKTELVCEGDHSCEGNANFNVETNFRCPNCHSLVLVLSRHGETDPTTHREWLDWRERIFRAFVWLEGREFALLDEAHEDLARLEAEVEANFASKEGERKAEAYFASKERDAEAKP